MNEGPHFLNCQRVLFSDLIEIVIYE